MFFNISCRKVTYRKCLYFNFNKKMKKKQIGEGEILRAAVLKQPKLIEIVMHIEIFNDVDISVRVLVKEHHSEYTVFKKSDLPPRSYVRFALGIAFIHIIRGSHGYCITKSSGIYFISDIMNNLSNP